jgi:methionine-gamma-lyase
MLSFEVRGGYDSAYQVIRRTRLCQLAVSLGGLESLITHPASQIHAHQSPEEQAAARISPGLLRLSVGAEDVADIIADLDQALAARGGNQ